MTAKNQPAKSMERRIDVNGDVTLHIPLPAEMVEALELRARELGLAKNQLVRILLDKPLQEFSKKELRLEVVPSPPTST